MKFRYLHFSILVILLILPHNSFAEEKQLIITSDMQYGYAQKLFNEQDYDTAQVEFKRFVHFFPDAALDLATTDAITAPSFAISIIVFEWFSENLKVEVVSSSVNPMASSTWLGRCTPALQAEPVEQAVPSESNSKSNPSESVLGKVIEMIPGKDFS